MKKLPHIVNSYIRTGDPESMEKIKKYLAENLKLDNLTPEYIESLPLLDVTQDIALHFNIDIRKIANQGDIEDQKQSVIIIVKAVFIAFFNIMKTEKSEEAAYRFACDFENALDIAHTIHNGLEKLIEAIPFEKLKDECLQTTQLINSKIQQYSVHFEWQKDQAILEKLCLLIHKEYNIIKAPAQFRKLMNGSNNAQIKVNEDKIGHFVYLISSLRKDGWLQIRKGKGFWVLLADVTINYDGEKLSKTKNSLKTLSHKINKKSEKYLLIINEIEDILKELTREANNY
jgi:hypothetical protein